MSAKATAVTLVVPSKGMQAALSIEHAERLLRMSKNGGWQLPPDSEFEYSAENGLTRKRNTAADKGATKGLRD